MRSLLTKLLAAAVLVGAAASEPTYAYQSCPDAGVDCETMYSGCAMMGGWPPDTMVICMTECSLNGSMMYSERCYLE